MSGVYDVLVQKQIKTTDEKIYDLKTTYYEDDKIENMLCSLLKNKWKVKPTFSEHITHLQTNQSRGKKYPLLLPEFYEFLTKHLDKIDAIFKTFILVNLFSSFEIFLNNVKINELPSFKISLFNSKISEKTNSSNTLDKSVNFKTA